MRRRLVIAFLSLLLLVAVGVLIVHAPPVRSYALQFAIRVARGQGVELQAERLDYDLFTRHIRLANVKVSATGDPQAFFVADEVLAIASSRVFFREIAFDEVSIRNGAVSIVRRADGTTNLPKSSGAPSERDPAPLPIARVNAPRLAVEYRDEPADLTFRTSALTIDLSPRGRLALEAPADFSVGSTSTRFERIESEAAFDGRDLRLSALRLEAQEFRGQVEGVLALIRRQPSMDLRVAGDSELTNAGKWWGQTADEIRGGVHLEGTVSGPMGDPLANLRATSNRLSWQRLDLADVSATVRLDDDGLLVDESRALIASGQFTATGAFTWEGGRANIKASWRDVDAAQFVSAISNPSVTPSGRTSGEATAAGSLDSIDEWNVDARVALEDGQRGRGRIPAPGEARFNLTSGTWTLDASHVVGEVAPVSVVLMGQLRGAAVSDSAMTGTLQVSETDLDGILQMLSEVGLANVQRDLVIGAIRASADVEGTVGKPVLRLVVQSDRAVAAGQEVVDVEARGSLDGSTFQLEELIAAQPMSSSGENAPGRVRATGQFNLSDQAYMGTVNATSWRLSPTPDLPLSGLVSLDYSGQGRGRIAFGKAQVVSNLIVSQDIALGEVVADLDLQGDHANIAARATDFNAMADGSLGFDPPYLATVRVNAAALDLARAVTGVGLPVMLDGTANLRLEAEGPLEEWRNGRASLEVAALDGHVQTLPIVLREPARLRYDEGRVVVERLEASVGRTIVSATGALPVSVPLATSAKAVEKPGTTTDAVLASLTGDLYDVAVAAALAANPQGSATVAPITAGKGRLALLARITGSLESPAYVADLEVGPGMVQARSDLAPIENLLVQAHVENGQLDLRNFTGTYHGANVTAMGHAPLALLSGRAPSSERDAVLSATAVGITAAVLTPFVDASTISQVGGSLDAKLDLSSSSLNLEDLEGEVVLDRLNLTIAELPVTQRTPTRVIARDGFARIQSWAWESEGTSIEVTGQVHLSDQQTSIQANGKLDARLLTPFLGNPSLTTAGQVDMRLSVSGALAEPTINGDVRLANGELRLRDPRIVASELNATAVLARGNVFITSLSGTVNGGMLSGSGQVQYTPEVQGQFTSTVTGMAMNFPEGLRTEVDSSLQLTTTVKDGAPANQLSGLVTIRRGAYREPLALVTGLLNNLQRSGTTTGAPPSPFLQSLALDVRVITDDDVIIDNNVAKAQLGADLRLINVASAPALSGRAELREGGRLFLGRNTYFIKNGAIDFVNPSMIEPTLAVEASTRVSGYDIDIRIMGTPETLMTELDSTDPDLARSPLDMTALLLTGRKANELGDQEVSDVGAQVLGNVAGDVLGFAGRAVGLDTLRVGAETNPRDPADLASETDPTSRVTFGKSFGSKVDVTLSQSLVESNEQTWILDYLPVRQVALRFVQNDEELRSYEFRHDLAFGGPPRAVRSANTSRDLEQPRVSSIRIAGDTRFAEEQLHERLRLKQGDRFDFIKWQDDRDRLERFYQERQHLAARVTTEREDAAGGVELTYMVDAGPETRIQVAGMTLPRSALQEIETAWTQSVFDGFLIEEVEGIVRRELANQATHQPKVEVKVEGNESLRTLIVDVTPGPRAERIEVRLEGVAEQLRSDLMKQVGDRPHAVQALTNPQEYERVLLAALRARGYPQASVSVGAPFFQETVAGVPVTVNPGPQFRVGMVGFEGASSIPLTDLGAETRLEEGAFYRVEDIAVAQMRLQTRYRQEGFTTASFDSRETVREAEGRIDVTFVVQEGARQVVQEIAISGVRSVDEDVVKDTLRLKVGDPLRTSDWLEARRRLFESGLFRRVDIDIEPLDGVAETAPVRVRVSVEEWPALRLRYGLQVAEERPEENVKGRDLVPGISADLTRRTLFGRAITVGVAGQYENLERVGRVFMNKPTLFGWPVQSSLTIERSREEFQSDTLVTSGTTAAWEQRGRWRRRLNVSYGLRFERNRTFDTGPGDPILGPSDVTVHIGRLTSSATWDTRDDASDTRRGTFVSTSLEHGTSWLASDLLFLRSLTQAYYFQPWKTVVFASAARYGAVKPLEGQTLISTLRFFAGGARTVRGVPEDSLGGLDFLGQPIGGRGLLTLNQEMRFPMYKWLRGVVFIDAGNVFPEGSGVRLAELVGSTGAGLRLVTPFALFRVDYGRTIWNRPAPDSGQWVFGIGQTF